MAQKFIYYPVKPWIISQGFAANNVCSYPNRTGIVSAVVCPPGKTKLYPLMGYIGHPGTDVAAKHGQPIYAPFNGTVTDLMTDPMQGLGVDIISDVPYQLDPDPKAGFKGGSYHVKFRNFHMLGLKVRLGQRVTVGELLGWADNTGVSSRDHDHCAMKPQIKSGGVWVNLLPNNKLGGAVDFIKYLTGLYAQDNFRFRHTFYKNLEYGMHDPEIVFLQKALQIEGLLPKDFEPTDYYHNLTKAGVLAFWKKYRLTTVWENWTLQGKNFGPKSRAKMNQLYG